MKLSLKLLVLLTASLLGGSTTFAQTNTDVVINYPFYLYAYNNLESVTFDFTNNTAPTLAGQAVGDDITGKTATLASLANYTTCLDASIPDTPLTQIIDKGPNATFGTSTATTCSFAPTEVTKYSNFAVTSSTSDADGWLLVVSNSTAWKVDTSIDTTDFTDFSSAQIHLSPDFGDNYTNVTAAASLGDQDDFYRTNRSRHYVLPLTYALVLDPFDGGLIDPTTDSLTGSTTTDGSIVVDTSSATAKAVITYTFAIP